MPPKSSEKSPQPISPILIELMERAETADDEAHSELSDNLTPEKLHTLARIGGMIENGEKRHSARELVQRLIAYAVHCWEKNPEKPQDDQEALAELPEFAKPLAIETRKAIAISVSS